MFLLCLGIYLSETAPDQTKRITPLTLSLCTFEWGSQDNKGLQHVWPAYTSSGFYFFGGDLHKRC